MGLVESMRDLYTRKFQIIKLKANLQLLQDRSRNITFVP